MKINVEERSSSKVPEVGQFLLTKLYTGLPIGTLGVPALS